MFLGIYRFEGAPEPLQRAYDSLIGMIPHDGLHLHLCVADAGGLSIYDCCPSREAFVAFSGSAALRGALRAAGLPAPQVTQVGDVHAAFVAGQRTI